MRLSLTTAAIAATCVSAATAEIVTVTYDFPHTAGRAMNYLWFGNDAPVEGQIVSTRVFITYTADEGLDAADFFSLFAVPVIEPLGGSEAFWVEGDELGWEGTGTFVHTDETDAFNGMIRAGRFGWEVDGGGTLSAGSRIEFDVLLVPAPSAAGLLAAGGLIALRRRR